MQREVTALVIAKRMRLDPALEQLVAKLNHTSRLDRGADNSNWCRHYCTLGNPLRISARSEHRCKHRMGWRQTTINDDLSVGGRVLTKSATCAGARCYRPGCSPINKTLI